jgi:hypothetical protein
LAGTALSLSQRGNVCVVVNAGCHAAKLMQPAPQIEFRPALDLMRAANPAGFPVNRPSKPYTDARNWRGPREFWQGLLDLLPNTGRAPDWIHSEFQPLEDSSGLVPEHQLEFGPANFNANNHCRSGYQFLVLKFSGGEAQGGSCETRLPWPDFRFQGSKGLL